MLWKFITFKFKDVGEAFQDMRNQSKDFKNNKNEDTV